MLTTLRRTEHITQEVAPKAEFPVCGERDLPEFWLGKGKGCFVGRKRKRDLRVEVDVRVDV